MIDQVDEMIRQVLAGQETESELGRVRAYRACVRYAEEQLSTSHLCNVFLLRAAEELGQQPMAVPVVHNRVPVPTEARVCFYFHDDEGPVLVGNPGGLRYLGSILSEMADSPLPGECIVLEPEFAPFISESEGITIYCESEDWFDAAEDGTQEELAAAWEAELDGRIMTSEEVVALQLDRSLSSSVALSPRKIYRIAALKPYRERDAKNLQRKWYRQETERLRIFELTDDDGKPVKVVLDLDDPDVTFYYPWHLEQLHG